MHADACVPLDIHDLILVLRLLRGTQQMTQVETEVGEAVEQQDGRGRLVEVADDWYVIRDEVDETGPGIEQVDAGKQAEEKNDEVFDELHRQGLRGGR